MCHASTDRTCICPPSSTAMGTGKSFRCRLTPSWKSLSWSHGVFRTLG